MSIKPYISKNALYLFTVILLSGGIYGLCDYYLQSVAKEIMLNWAETEAISIQEGNLLTSITKTQRFLISSSYVKGVRLVKFENGELVPKIEFGMPFEVNANDVESLSENLTQQRIGFLHQRTYYKIPQQQGFVLVFDVNSGFLMLLFFVSSTTIVALIVYLIWSLQRLEQKESAKREALLKLAIDNLLESESLSPVLEKEVPGLVKWWKVKKSELARTRAISTDQQSKILLGEMASRTVHDIKGALRNIRTIANLSAAIEPSQKKIIEKSLDRVTKISQGLLDSTRSVYSDEKSKQERLNVAVQLKSIIESKEIQYGSSASFEIQSSPSPAVVVSDPLQFERSISNLIDNAVEASSINSLIRISVASDDESVEIAIQDSGKGISPENLRQIGTKGFTHGKANGTGIGVFYAKKFVEELGGKFQIESKLGKGTKIRMTFRNSIGRISLRSNEHFLMLEDQSYLRLAAQFKLDELGFPKFQYQIFSTPNELEGWLCTNKSPFRLYSDHFLENANETGVQVIKRLGIADRSVLFTSAFDDPAVIRAASEIGVDVISKDEFFGAKISLTSSKQN